ncbi:MAG: type II secretion system F family protein [Proteobacteria bacterium]|nr:type II secretion system F family protein [Pseudomonadota bacterium]
MFSEGVSDLAFIFMVAVAVGGGILALVYPLISASSASRRVEQITTGKKEAKSSFRARFQEDSKDARRRQIQDSLKQIEDKEKERKKKLTLRNRIEQAGLDIPVRMFWMLSAVAGVLFFIVPTIFGLPLLLNLGLGFVGFLGFPRWFLNFLRKRRQNIFLNDFADAIDVMVRGLKAGLPVSEAMKIIAAESGPPVGPEFMEVVDGQRIGISIDQGIERMVDRMPLAEVNFLAIVMTIQAKTGGNLSEALSNLSRVLRDRKKMKAKIKAVSQEAKSSAAIIGSLPFIIMGALTVLNPNYLKPMLETNMGHILMIGSGVWMLIGVLIMRKMINFEI